MPSLPQTVLHQLPPLVTTESKILILGTMPSPRSRAEGFYYAHPQNRFWRVIAAIYGEGDPQTIEDRTALLHAHGLALLCRFPNITRICTTGSTAARLYHRLIEPQTGLTAITLPSPSAANARTSFLQLLSAYRAALLL